MNEKAPHLSHPKYRPDIDGLRALAVLSVVGYHAFPGWITGGFVGVDVFFVISGYLISTIIFENLKRNTFSFAEFYARRVNRIFPALLVVLAACFALGWFALIADEYKQLGKHIAAGAGFVSNLVLWSESGYFDNAAEAKPLLHLWSLGIEEQFYIIWPLLVWLSWKRKAGLLAITVTILVASFALNIYGIQRDAVATFYSPLTRFWELLCGGLLAWFVLHRKDTLAKLKAVPSNLLSLFGIALLGLEMFLATKKSVFPGWLALVPVLGAVLIILAGVQAWINRALLSNRIVVWFGLISFPLYLWHWLLLSFARIVEGGQTPGKLIRGAAILASILLAWLTHSLVEKPFRSGVLRPSRLAALILLMATLGCAGYGIYTIDGLSQTRLSNRVNPEILKALGDWEYPDGLTKTSTGGLGFYANTSGAPEILFFGDSHIEQFSPRVVQLSKESKAKNVAFVTSTGCLPVPNVFEDLHPNCDSLIKSMETFLKAYSSVKTVVIGACWNCYFIRYAELPTPGERDEFRRNEYHYYYKDKSITGTFRGGPGTKLALTELGNLIKKLSLNYSVYLLLDNPTDRRFNPVNMLGGTLGRRGVTFQAANSHSEDIPKSLSLDAQQSSLNDELRNLAVESGATVIDQLHSLCPGNVCPVLDSRGRPLYLDEHHMRPFFVRDQAHFIDQLILN